MINFNLRLSLYISAKLVEPNEINRSASALYDYHAYKLCSGNELKEMYRNGLKMIDTIAYNPKVEESITILNDFIYDKIHFTTS